MIGVLVFPDFQLLDAAGPISVFEIAGRFAGQPAVDQGARGSARPGAQLVRRRVDGAGFAIRRRDLDLDCRRRRGRSRGVALRQGAGLRAGCGKARRPHRQRLFGGLHSRRSRPARRPPRHHALAAHPAFPVRLPQGEARARSDLRPRRRYLEFGRHQCRHRSGAGDGGGGFRRRGRAGDRAPARALSSPQRRAVAVLIAVGIEGANRALRAAADLGARASRCTADGGASGRAGRHEFAAFHPRLHCRDRHHAVEGGGAPADRGGAATGAILRRGDRACRAKSTGFRDPERMRRAFIRAFGQPPQSLRRAARAG